MCVLVLVYVGWRGGILSDHIILEQWPEERKESRLILCQLDWATGSPDVQLNTGICKGVWMSLTLGQKTEWSRLPSPAWLGLTHPTEGMDKTKSLRKGESTFHLTHWCHSAFRHGLRLELTPSALLLLRSADSDQTYIIHSPGKILALHSLHNHISQFIKINLFLDLPGLTSYILTNPL